MVASTIAPPRRRVGSRAFLCFAGALATGLLTGCGSRDNSRFSVVVIGKPGDAFRTGTARPLASLLTRASTAEGLVSFDEQGRVVPALADRWIVTDDGDSYIFRLRDGEWRDGTPLTAKSARAALEAAMRAVRGTPMGLDLSGIEDVRVMAGRVIEIRLYRPMPYLLQLLAQPELGLQQDNQGDGPMALTRRGEVARFTPIEPSRLGMPQVPDWEQRTRSIDMTSQPAESAVSQFNDGLADLVLGGTIADFPLTSSVGILRGTIQLDPVQGLFGLQVSRAKGFLADVRNREALAMAIDRPALIAPFGVGGWTPSTRLLAAGLEGDVQTNGERWTDMTLVQRRAEAAGRIRQWQEAEGPPRVAIWLPAGPGSDILFDRLSADFQSVGVASERARDRTSADLRLIDEVAGFPRARWYLNRLSCVARKGLCDPEADTIVSGAVPLEDADRRAALLAEAEARLTQANVFIPFGSPIRWSLVRGTVNGFATNAGGWHPLMPLAWLRK